MTKQIETATVVANITAPGNGTMIVTGAYIVGSPVTVSFAVLLGDNSNAAALSARTALALNSAVCDQYQVSGATDKIVLTDRQDRANDTSLNIATSDGTCTGITAAPASANTVSGSGLTNAYATLAELRYYASTRGGQVSTDAADDSVVEDVLNTVSRYIDGQCSRRFYANTVDETRYYTAQDEQWIFVDDLSTDPTSVAVDYNGNRSYADVVASTDYDLLPENAFTNGMPANRLEMHWDSDDYFPDYRSGVRVIGKFGFPSVPLDIKNACLGIALNIYNSRSGITSAGNVTVTAMGVVVRPQDVPVWAQATIQKYRRYV